MPLPSTPRRARTFRPFDGEEGAALLTVLLMLALVSALTLTLAVITVNNLASARLAQQAGASLNASDAGIAEAVTYMRENGVSALNACSPTCATLHWGNSSDPQTVTIPGKAGQSYKVWIEPLSPYPANTVGYYRIHSTGIAGGPAGRTATMDAEISGFKVPIGLMSNSVTGGGNSAVHHESIFTTGCVWKRSQIAFSGIDAAYGIPAAVHSSQYITDDQGSGNYCSPKKPIHDPSRPVAQKNCNTAYPYDQDKNGGDLTGTSCYQAYNGTYPTTSLISSDQDLFNKFNLSPEAFTQAQLDQLKTVAVSEGNYWTSSTGWTVPTQDNAVLYFDLAQNDPGGLVDLNNLSPAWSRPVDLTAGDPNCTARSLLIIIAGGNARLNSNSNLAAATFLVSKDPYGNVVKANGTSTYTGTLYSNNLDLTGTTDFHLDTCFLANPSPALTNVRTFNYREIDR